MNWEAAQKRQQELEDREYKLELIKLGIEKDKVKAAKTQTKERRRRSKMGEAAAVIEDKTTEEEVNWMNDDGKTGEEEGEGDGKGTEGVDDADKEEQGGEKGEEDKGKAGKN